MGLRKFQQIVPQITEFGNGKARTAALTLSAWVQNHTAGTVAVGTLVPDTQAAAL